MATLSTKPLAAVTGASSGIGFELARQFAQNGFDLVIAAEDEGIAAAARALEALGARVDPVRVDLATYEGVEALYERIRSAARPLEAIAINAGVGVGGDFARETDLQRELELIRLNVTSTVHLTKRVVADMVARGKGRVLITSSIAAVMPSPFEAVYGASKAFDLSFASSLREELKDTGVTVTALLPGPTDTNFFHRAGMDDTKAGTESKDENDPADVARQGFEALMRGDDRVVAASLKTKLEGAAARFLPESVKAAWHRTMSEPGTAKK
ncbi:MAG TPA: SDR family NAD(P)-dependent oxidoreductase [Polyangiaceae bacterium]|nr:SDR family NAD(P)-dependent oxidoreductase [Polyangiaceae bacterium]